MRKLIQSKRDNKKRQRRNRLLGGILLVGLMFMSVAGYSFQSRNIETIEEIDYEGTKFIAYSGFWKTNILGQDFYFRYLPTETEAPFNTIDVGNVTSTINYIENYQNSPLYLVSKDYMVNTELTQNLYPVAERIQAACLENQPCEDENLPIKTCGNNLIYVEKANSSSIIQAGNCVFIYSPEEDLLKTVDEFLYKILRIKI